MISKEIKKLWEEKNKRLTKFAWCKYCSDSGCDNPDFHEQQLMQFAYELRRKRQPK